MRISLSNFGPIVGPVGLHFAGAMNAQEEACCGPPTVRKELTATDVRRQAARTFPAPVAPGFKRVKWRVAEVSPAFPQGNACAGEAADGTSRLGYCTDTSACCDRLVGWEGMGRFKARCPRRLCEPDRHHLARLSGSTLPSNHWE